MDNLEIAKALFGQKPQTASSGGQTTTAYGIATSDSVNGSVRVNLGGDTESIDDDQSIEVDTTFAVFEGDEVIVSLVGADGTGKAPCVIGVVGRGDQQQTEINSVINYVWNDAAGLHVSTQERSVQGANILIDSDSMDIRNGNSNSESDQTVYASFGREVTVGSRGYSTVGQYSQVFGQDCKASGAYAHAEGFNTVASGDYSHAEGGRTTASGSYSHTEGSGTSATSEHTHAEGINTQAIGRYAHAEGASTHANGDASHAEGSTTTATGSYSHAEGYRTEAKVNYAHAEGDGTITGSTADSKGQHVQGRYNVDTDYPYADVVGNGDLNGNTRSNAYNMDWNGNAEFQGEVYVGGCTPNGETPYPVVRYNTSNSHQEYYDKVNSTWAQVPGGGGGSSWTLLWTNANPTSSFAAQNVDVDITNYSVFMVQYRQSTTSDARVSVFVVKNGVNHIIQNIGVIISSGNITLSARNVKTNGNTGFTFEGAYRKNATSTSAGSLNNSQLIPTAIYGVC